MASAESLQQKLTTALEATEVSVVDTTPPGASCGASFEVSVVSALFEGKTLIARHRMVNEALKEELRDSIHALSVKKTITPAQQQKQASAAAAEGPEAGTGAEVNA